MKILVMLSFVLTTHVYSYCQEKSSISDSIIYTQNLSVLPPFPKNYFLSIKGDLSITKEKLFFKAINEKHRNYEFKIDLVDIESVKKWGAFLIPNPWFLPIMIKLKLNNGKKNCLSDIAPKKAIVNTSRKSP